jgi:Raf kinase inhibitor-like YbhB/YbcL family protein
LWLFAFVALVLGSGLVFVACDDDDDDNNDGDDDDDDATDDDNDAADDDAADDDNDAADDDDDDEFTFGSSAFEDGDTMPDPYTCAEDAGNGVSPPLFWDNPPAGTVAYAITFYDTDIDFGHWGLINIPADVLSLAEGLSPGSTLPGDAFEVLNDFGNVEYDGPCPPPDETHNYEFTLWALSAEIEPTKDLCVHSVLPLLQMVAIQVVVLAVTFGL